MSENKDDFTEKRASFTMRNLVIGVISIFLAGGTFYAAWNDLKADNAKTRELVIAELLATNKRITGLNCDVAYIRNDVSVYVQGKSTRIPLECQ